MPITKSQAERESKRLKVSTDHKIVTFNGHDRIQEEWNQLKQDKREATLSEELLLYHHRLGHTGFDKLREMARQGVIPTYLAKAPAPRCMACMYSKATRRQWRNKQQEGWTRTAAAQYPGHIGVGGPTGLTYPGVDRPDDWAFNEGQVQGGYRICGSVLQLWVRPPAEVARHRGNTSK